MENYREQLNIAAKQNVKEREYWLNKLSGELTEIQFPYDYKSSRYKETGDLRPVETETFFWSGELFPRLMELSRHSDFTLHMILTAGLVLLLYKYTGTGDIVTAAPIYRQEVEAEYINTLLVLRNRFEESISFKELLLQVREAIIEATKNYSYPIRLLLEEEGKPFPGTALLVENIHDKNYLRAIQFDVLFSFFRTETAIEGVVEYNPLLYRKSTVQRFITHFKRLLEAVAADLRVTSVDTCILSDEEKEQLLYAFNDVPDGGGGDRTIHGLFEEQAERTPDRTAIVGVNPKSEIRNPKQIQNSNDRNSKLHLTYRELDKRADQLAYILRGKGVEEDSIVGLMVGRSTDMIIGILGILKAGGAYLPIGIDFPPNRVISMLDDSGASLLLTTAPAVGSHSFTRLQGVRTGQPGLRITAPRRQIDNLDDLPLLDRTLADYERYSRYIGQAMVKNSITLQATRGCPYKCAYCFKIWPGKHVRRSAENIFAEIKHYYDMGVRRFVLIDDIFNFDKENSSRFFRMVIENRLKIQLLFPSGLRGDILSPEYIDLMVEAGTIGLALALETASPRLQKLIKKNLDLERFRENIRYFCEKHPRVILELQTMHGFPTETEEEALKTLEFIKSLKWVDFPYIHLLKIFPNTDMEKIAIEHGVSKAAITRTMDRAYHEFTDTLPFDRAFTKNYQSDFLNNYFLSKERLLHVLPHQMRVLTEDELIQKYDSYLPVEITSFNGLLEFLEIEREQLGIDSCLDEQWAFVPDLNEKIREAQPPKVSPSTNALRVLLLDLTVFFSGENTMLYDVLEPPLGLIYLLSYLNREFGESINGKIAKSRIDFDNYFQLKALIEALKPDVIGLRGMTFYRDFFHKTAALIRQWGFAGPVIVGGPYATSSYETVSRDPNVDVLVLGEGEITFGELIREVINNNKQLPGEDILRNINGIAFAPGNREGVKTSGREILFLDQLSTKDSDSLRRGVIGSPRSGAYVMYTSGSTGTPRGILTTHRNVLRVVKDTNYIRLVPGDRLLQLSNYEFDGSVFDIYGALLNGASLHLISREDILDVERLSGLIKRGGITVFFVTTALFNALVDVRIDCFDGIRNVLFGGERVSVEHVKKALAYMDPGRIIHVYGPTEGTVYATYYPINEVGERAATIPIGGPLTGTGAYILDKHKGLVPIGVVGDLYLSGTGLARGYLNNSDLTNQKFCGGPRGQVPRFSKEPPGRRRHYKTGDLARWLPNGAIEFVGRTDHQVKLRGFRIELGEIESRLVKHEHVKEALVIVDRGVTGSYDLCAYVVPSSSGALDIEALKNDLALDLPRFMIPSYIVPLEVFPLTPNGKIDTRVLPAIRDIETGSGAEYAAPRNEVEEKLLFTWRQVLGRDNIGINENFFLGGGDSIKAIQMASRMKQAGYKIETRDIFQYPSISELAPLAKRVETTAGFGEQEPVTGSVPLTPVQEWFFERNMVHPHHFNHANLLFLKEPVGAADIETIFRKIQEHHDALRTTFILKEGEIRQTIHGPEYPFDFREYFFLSLGEEEAKRALEAGVNEIQAGLNLETGPLMKVAMFHLSDGDRLLVVIHHLVIDTVSWRILSEDVDTLYRQLKQGEPLRLPPRTGSFKTWSEKLSQYAHGDHLLKEKEFWTQLEEAPVSLIKKDHEAPGNKVKDTQTLVFRLSREETRGLLTKTNNAFGTEINDILLTALGLAFKGAFGIDRLFITMEGHGREDILEGVDVGRTIGWFTCMFPVLLDVSGAGEPETDLARCIKQVKENLRRVPSRGIGYGILNYLSGEKLRGRRAAVLEGCRAAASFNYLGQFDTELSGLASWAVPAEESAGESLSPEQEREHELDIIGSVFHNRLEMSFTSNTKHFNKETVQALADSYKDQLGRIITFCSSRDVRERTPSDLTYKGLSIGALEQLGARYPIDDIYPLAPMQEGMLFHALAEPEATAYFVQTSYRLDRELDPAIMEKSLNELFKRHDILRTVFVHEGVPRPQQVVLQQREAEFFFEDITPVEGKEDYIKNYKENDRRRRFDLTNESLLRLTVFREAPSQYRFIWSLHHILMDGWCLGILLKDLDRLYECFSHGKPVELRPAVPYKQYIKWLEARDKREGLTYWREYLDGYLQPAPFAAFGNRESSEGYKVENFHMRLPGEFTGPLNRLAVENQATLNTVFQTLWGILLQVYNNTGDIVFGAVVSGRPPEIDGVESMVGLFINTLPVRIRTGGDMPFSRAVKQVQGQSASSKSFEYLSLAEIQGESLLKGQLIDHFLAFQNFPLQMADREEVSKIDQLESHEQSNYNFNIIVTPGDSIHIALSYNSLVFDPGFIKRTAGHFREVIRRVIGDPNVQIDRIGILTEEEREQVLVEFNRTAAPVPGDKTLHQLFEEQVERTPDRPAAVYYENITDDYKTPDSLSPGFPGPRPVRGGNLSPGADVLLLGDTTGTGGTGLLYLASYLKRNGIRARCRWNDTETQNNRLEQEVKDLLFQSRPKIVGVSMKWFPHIARVFEICRIVKETDPSVNVVVGGNTASYYWENIIQFEYVDIVVRGDGEVPLLKICRGEDEAAIPNITYKKDGQILSNPITYVQDESNSGDIFLSHLDEIFISDSDPYLAEHFYINTGKGCSQQCFYCAGCRDVQVSSFNRKKPFLRGIEEVRKDMMAARDYTSTFFFDFDLPAYDSMAYYRELWDGIDLSRHFCQFYFWKLPSAEFIGLVTHTFKHVYLNIDMCSLSEDNRKKLESQRMVKPQPTDEDIFSFFETCEAYDNVEVKINQIAGVPYFSSRDMEKSNAVLSRILNNYSCFRGIDWGRLHAQPGAPVIADCEKYGMVSHARTFDDFLHHSRKNMKEENYPGLENIHYPYIYWKDDELNAAMGKFYSDTVRKLKENREQREKPLSITRVLTYSELDERAGRVAALLLERGLRPGDITALMVADPVHAACGILGILKAGGAYLPIDPAYPRERIDYMLADSAAAFLLTADDFAGLNRTYTSYRSYKTYLPAGAGSAAYVIYTSGSTGVPRGVVVEHRGAVNTLLARRGAYNMGAGDTALQLFSYAFDGYVTGFFTPVVSGAKVVLLNSEEIKNISWLRAAVRENKVTHFIAVPALFRVIADNFSAGELVSLKVVTLAGDKLEYDVLKKAVSKNSNLEIVNEYGVTEAAVMSTIFRHQERDSVIKIGRPIWNTSITILGKGGQPLPVGIAGEMCLSGPGTARGYLNNPELTNKKFFGGSRGAPVTDGSYWAPRRGQKSPPGRRRHYKTGDLARWLSNGPAARGAYNIEFLGRMDRQLKVRGFRIEPGEIEARLKSFPAVDGCVVTGNSQRLCAYITASGPLDNIREFLSRTLPDHMIPTYFVTLNEFPLTPGGKIDRNALPDPVDVKTGDDKYIAPGNKIEEKLAETWQDVLGRERVGTNENFFIIGGDSIKSIQVISRMHADGYKLEMKDIFNFPTISELARNVKESRRPAGQSPVTGPVPLTPIQKWFFAAFKEDRRHFVHAVLLHSDLGFDEPAVRAVFKKIQEHHDALRMTYKEEDGDIRQTVHGLEYPLSFRVYDLRDREETGEFERKAEKLRTGIDLENGPLMKLGLFRMAGGDRLLIVIHHLVVDGVSWRILFEDLENLYRKYKEGEPPALPLKSDSFKAWSETLQNNGLFFLKEKEYWSQLESTPVPRIEPDFLVEDNFVKDVRTLSFRLSEEDTESLLTTVNHAFGTSVNDILLTALGLSVKHVYGFDRLLVELEGHGRETLFEGVDVSRTVGWFTSVYPVLLDLSYETDLSRQVKEVKECLRRVPNNGIGYGVLKYLEKGRRAAVLEGCRATASFNYLGQFDADLKEKSFKIVEDSVGAAQDVKWQREHELEVSGLVMENRLTMSIRFNPKRLEHQKVETLSNRFNTELRRLISFCAGRERELTPADFTYPHLSLDDLERLQERYSHQIEDIYNLTPMQEGMLFHSLVETGDTPAYFQQVSYSLRGELNIPVVEKSLNELFKRHDILRTAFIYKDVERPVQLVLKNRQVDFYYEDSRKTDTPVDPKVFKENDRRRFFDPAKDVLMRISILRSSQTEYEFIWSFFHILMDGWCIGILNTEFFEIYNSYLESREYRLPPVNPFRTYIKWLLEQDKEAAGTYWKKYLDAYEEPAEIPRLNLRKIPGHGYKKEYTVVESSGEKTRRLNRFAGENNVTLNTVIQALWGIVLGKMNGKEDVVFGAVVSGRPSGIKGVETMVGLFINTVPVRVRFRGKQVFKELVRAVQEGAVVSEPFHFFPLAEIQSQSLLKRHLLDHILVFENYPLSNREEGGGVLEITGMDVFEQTNYDLNLGILPHERLRLRFDYNGNVYDRDDIKRIADFVNRIIDLILDNEEVEIDRLTLLSEEEKHRVLYDFNNTDADYPADKTIPELFEEQAARKPDFVVLIGLIRPIGPIGPIKSAALSYGELNKRANQTASFLKEKGVGTGTIVGLKMESSIEMIIAMLAILKAGAAYLPIDPGYPEDRTNYMLTDCNVKMLLSELSSPLPATRNSQPATIFCNLAYIIYTSGSTGRPKGVMVEHRNVVRLVKNPGFIDFHPGQRLLKTGSIVFDITTFEIWGPLLNGVPLVAADKDMVLNIEELSRWVIKDKISVLHLIPQLFNQVVEQFPRTFAGLEYFLVGGDMVRPGPVNRLRDLYPELKIIHCYGPTENTTFSTTFQVAGDYEGRIPIGTPINNSSVYILDARGDVQPIGVVGELHVGGAGVARGYLNNPELTNQKFLGVQNPFFKKGFGRRRHYKTGDLARWLPDGTIAFLGRIDSQVKVRGFRIELGEIETQLLKHDVVKEAVVSAKLSEAGDNYLCAYIVPVQEVELSVSQLRDFLSGFLPDYMIPSYFVQLEEIPVTSNGKIDRKVLAAYKDHVIDGTGYEAPQGEIEHVLAGVWQDILGLEQVGMNDNFFEKGGDSIKAIQVSAKLLKHGLKLEVRDLFLNPSIKQQVHVVKGVDRIPDQGPVEGRVELIPVQRHFFEKNTAHPHRWSHSLLLYGKEGFDAVVVETVLKKLTAHHDALRMSYQIEDNRVIQENRGLTGGSFDLEILDLTGEEDIETAVGNASRVIGESISLTRGPLVALGLFRTRNGDYLSVVIHHLVVDGISWRVLLEDLETGFRRAAKGEEITFPPKTDSFKTWAEKLVEYSTSAALLNELPYWRGDAALEIKKLPVDGETSPMEINDKSGETVYLTLDEEQTSKLLKEVNRAYNTEINDILLTALGMAVKEWAGIERVAIRLEGHGREPVVEDVDITRTVGWFTSMYPVFLDLHGVESPGDGIKSVKETLRRVPSNGIGYGILKYLTPEDKKGGPLLEMKPEIGFNYLGQFDRESPQNGEKPIFEISRVKTGGTGNPELESDYLVDINGIVTDGKLEILFHYRRRDYRRTTMETLAGFYKSNLIKLIDHCTGKEERELTVSDFSATEIDDDQLEKIFEELEED